MDADTEMRDTEQSNGIGRPDFLLKTHDASWSANLETERYAFNRERLIADALAAIECTLRGSHVNLVTHAAHGSPDAYLADPIERRFPEADATVVDQCGCGGYVYRVHR